MRTEVQRNDEKREIDTNSIQAMTPVRYVMVEENEPEKREKKRDY